jgi:hypothetical protein
MSASNAGWAEPSRGIMAACAAEGCRRMRSVLCELWATPMTETMPRDMSNSGRFSARPVAVGFAIAAGAVAAGTAALWFHYGTEVFYETLVAGFNACF